MKTFISLVAVPLLLIGCNASNKIVTQDAIKEGAALCQLASVTNTAVVALANSVGVPVKVTDATSKDVALACALVAAIPVAPPVDTSHIPVVSAPVTTLPPVTTPIPTIPAS